MHSQIHSYITSLSQTIDTLNFNEIEEALKIIEEKFLKGKKVATCGNGGSALTASHYITDWTKMTRMHTGKRLLR